MSSGLGTFCTYGLLSHGVIITGLIWSSILALLIDRKLRQALLFSVLAFALSLVGLIHVERIGFSFTPITIGYLLLWCCLDFFTSLKPGEKQVKIL